MATKKQSKGGGGGCVVEEIGPSRKKLTITIPAETVNEQLETSMEALVADAALPGFRPGRAPRRLVEKRFGSAVAGEAKNQLIASAFSQAIEEHKITVLGDPEGNEELAKLELAPNTAVTFSVEVEVAPEFDLPTLDGLEIIKPMIEPTQAQVDEYIKRLAINEGSLEPHDKAEAGDYCIGTGVMKIKGGEEVMRIPGAVIQVPPPEKEGKGAILGVIVDDFAKQIGTPKNGDTLHVKCKGPESHENEAIRGKDLEVEFQVDQCQRIVPASVADLVAKYGLESEQSMRESVMLRLNQRVLVEQQSAMRQQLAQKLHDAVDLALPEKLSSRQAERNLARQRMELLYRGVDEQQIEERIAELRTASSEMASRELKLFFILNKAAEQMEIGVTEEEVLGRIAQMAAERGERPDKLRKALMKNNQIQMIAQQIREHKTMDSLLGKAKITEMPAEEFNAKMGAAAGGKDGGAAKGAKGSKKK